MSTELDLLLMDPPVSLQKRYSIFSSGGNKNPAWGLVFIASVAKREGYRVAIQDLNVTGLDIESFRNFLLTTKPRIVGITASSLGVSDAAQVATIVKQTLPDTLTILGGSHVSAVPEQTLLRYPQFDLGAIGEGEITTLELLRVSSPSPEDFSKINGLAWRNRDNIMFSSPRQLITDMSWLPELAMELLPHLGKYYSPPIYSLKLEPAVAITWTRGCPNRCTFCSNNLIHGCSVRYHSVDYLMNWIHKMIKDYDIREIQFMDDTFTANPEYVAKFCERLIRSKTKIAWNCATRVNTLTEELVQLMARTGCWQISIGIESGNKEILRRMKKGISLKQVDNVIRWARTAGINVKGFFMMGFLGETHETLRETIDLAMKLPIQDLSMSIFVPYPGVSARKNIEEFGSFEENWDDMSSLNVNFVPHGFTREELLRINRAVYRKFYFRPRIVLAYLRRMRNPRFMLSLFKGFMNLMWSIFRSTKY
jgi:radical SAM superfamily enzyme YgiQ (UPF0313 family)